MPRQQPRIVFGAEDVDQPSAETFVFGADEVMPPSEIPPTVPARTWGETAADLLPTAGGFIGGMVGTVPGVRIATAGIGGAAGEGYRQLATHAGELPGAVVDVARNLMAEPTATLSGFVEGAKAGAQQAALQGAIQAAGQGGGEVLRGVASKASPWLMNRALNLTAKLSREFPNMSTTMLEQALTVSKGGLEKARALLKVEKGKATAALAQAQATGATVPITAATDGLQKTLIEVLNSADIEGGLATLAAVERRIAGGRAGALTPTAADALKTSLQTESKQLYAAAKMGQGKPNVSVRARALADMAASLNDAIGTITTNAGAEGYRAANAGAAELIGAVRGITTGIRPGANLYQAMVRPGVGAVWRARGGRDWRDARCSGGRAGGWSDDVPIRDVADRCHARETQRPGNSPSIAAPRRSRRLIGGDGRPGAVRLTAGAVSRPHAGSDARPACRTSQKYRGWSSSR